MRTRRASEEPQAEPNPAGLRMSLRSRRAFGDISNRNEEEEAADKPEKRQRTRGPEAAGARSGLRIYQDPVVVEESSQEGGSSSTGSPEDESPFLNDHVANNTVSRYDLPAPIIDEVDADDSDDPLQCAEYIMDMHRRYKELEELFTVNVYMHKQSDINGKMRAILIDWIVEVHLKFKFATATLYLACHIIDRYCMLEPVQRTKLQLVGVTALLIACKYEEIYPPEVRDCVYMTDNAYTREEVLKTEVKILTRLNFQITVPTTWTFLSRALKVCEATELQYQRACYYSERVLQEHEMLAFRPSMIAASAVFLARAFDVGDEDAWTPLLEKYTNLKYDHMNSCIYMMIQFVKANPITASHRQLVAVKKKFTQDRYLAVSAEPLPDLPKFGTDS